MAHTECSVSRLRCALTVEETASLLGKSVRSVNRLINAGEIEAEVVGRNRMVKARALIEKFGEPVEVAA